MTNKWLLISSTIIIFLFTYLVSNSENSEVRAQQLPTPLTDTIVFYSNVGGTGEDIFSIKLDGTNYTQLTNTPGDDHSPSVSPDGQYIYFNSNRDGNDEVYSMYFDGSGQIRLTNNPASDFVTSVSPDGQKLAGYSNRDGDFEIFTMNPDGSDYAQLTFNDEWDGPVNWSPDSQKLVFTSQRDGDQEIYTMNRDGTNQARLTYTPGVAEYVPVFSPDGLYIAYNNNQEIWRINADGTNAINLTNNPADEAFPQYSPDGSSIAYQRYDTNGQTNFGWNIYLMDPDGSNVRILADLPGNEVVPHWSPLSPAVTNYPPVINTFSAPLTPQATYTAVNVSANFSDEDISDLHTAVWNWGDNTISTGAVIEANGSGTVTGSHTYTSAGVYTLNLTVSDSLSSTDKEYMYIVVYDPNGGFATGAGRFNMSAGSIISDPGRSGMTSFGTNAKYVNNVLTGSTKLNFRDGQYSFGFDSTSYDWLVVTNGNQAQLHGSGTLNGSSGYTFTLTALDNSSDTLRLQIWDENSTLVFDNNTSTLSNGNIQVHN